MQTCKASNCDRRRHAREYCKKHYARLFRKSRATGKATKPNKIIIKGIVSEIIMYNKKGEEKARAIIDTGDVEKIINHRWRIVKGYVETHQNGGSVGIQNLIISSKPIERPFLDHRDRDPLNNRKSNLRFCTHAENTRNRGIPKNNKSGFKGVLKRGNEWIAQIGINKKTLYLGSFKNKITAAIAYNAACLKHHGEFAYLNPI